MGVEKVVEIAWVEKMAWKFQYWYYSGHYYCDTPSILYIFKHKHNTLNYTSVFEEICHLEILR